MYYILKEGRIIKCFAGYRQETGQVRRTQVMRERIIKKVLVIKTASSPGQGKLS
jgi:hypothetical protein